MAEFRHTHSTPVDPAFGFRLVRTTLEIPEFERPARQASFACHEIDFTTGEATERVIGTFTGGFVISEDLGHSWETISLRGYEEALNFNLEEAELSNAFFTANGSILAQVKALSKLRRDDIKNPGAILRLNSSFYLQQACSPGHSHWHGSRSIDQSGQTIMFAEYPSNKLKYSIGPDESPDEAALDLRSPAVYRSRNDGASWEKVFELSWRDIRHFHTLAADPFEAGTWWLSSGDKPEESRVWRSDDDGDSWIDVSGSDPALFLHPSIDDSTRSAFRYTDIWIGEKNLIWGADDWLGGSGNVDNPSVPFGRRAGSRLFVTEKSNELKPECLGYIGNPIRSLIDVGPAFVVTTEAKRMAFRRPQVFLVSKSDPELYTELFNIDVFRAEGTGFTYSRASRKAKNGIFFSFRASSDVTQIPTRILKWTVEFL